MSRHEELFGTPERAVASIEAVAAGLFTSAGDWGALCDAVCALTGTCEGCPARGARGCSHDIGAEEAVGWLKGGE